MKFKAKNNKYGKCREYEIGAGEIIMLVMLFYFLYVNIV